MCRVYVLFFKQKTAYEMRISDWSSDVCSSDLSEYMVRSSGYLRSLEDFRNVVLRTNEAGTPVLLGDVARIQIGPEMRRGIAELNGEGEVAGGVIVMRSDKNALATIDAVKAKLADLKRSLHAGEEVVSTCDRRSEERLGGEECVSKCRNSRRPY